MPVLHLKSVPKDVNDYILRIQYEIKVKKGRSQISKEYTIFQIIKEHKEMLAKGKV